MKIYNEYYEKILCANFKIVLFCLFTRVDPQQIDFVYTFKSIYHKLKAVL